MSALFANDEGYGARMRVACGVFGVQGAADAVSLVALGLHALQHRGQEGCGIAAREDGRFTTERHLGLVGDRFGGEDLPERFPGDAAIGHTRYSTQGESKSRRNLQPLYADLHSGGFAMAHNGNLTNSRTLRERLVAEGKIFQSTSDTEVILHLIAGSRRGPLVERFCDALDQIEGGYAIVALSKNKLIGARDPLGIRPLVLGDLKGAPVLASETCALELTGAKFVRDVEPGEVIVCEGVNVRAIKRQPLRPPLTCAFEYIYFARPNSIVDGVSVYAARKSMGARLAEEAPVENADVVVPVPDSGMPAAIGYAQAAGIPFDLGIIRAHHVGRTFIEPTQGLRDMKVRMKHQPNMEALAGKKVVLIDDSIVRGTTSKAIARMVKHAGAREVHWRTASPMITHPDYYGIDMADRDEFFVNRHDDLDSMRRALGVDSLAFLSLDGLYRAITGEARQRGPHDLDPTKALPAPGPKGTEEGAEPGYRRLIADHYFTGEYPTRLTDLDRGKADKAEQLSFLEQA